MLTRRWSVFLYAMMMSFFAVIIGYIITMKMDTLLENSDIQTYDTRLHSNLSEKADIAISYDTLLNTNGSGFIDTIACPNSVSMDGTLAGGTLETISTVPFFNNTQFVCSGSTSQGNLLLSYSSGGNVFETGSYRGSNITLLPLSGTGIRTGIFTDVSSTAISFTATGTFSHLDLNADSDNFQTSSSGTIIYPNGQIDDDTLARKTLYGYVHKGTGWYDSFNINTPLRKYIAGNIFNTGSDMTVPSTTQTGYLRLDIDNPYSIKIVEFSRIQFDTIKELRAIASSSATFSTGGMGWIMSDLSLSGSKTGAKIFNLQDKDYAVFLSFSGNLTSTWVDFLKYKITMENEYGSGIYIVPLDDSGNGIIKCLGQDIIIDKEGKYRYKQFEVVR